MMEKLNIDRILANLLAQREVSTYKEAEAYFRPKLENLLDPFLMKDMDKAVERIFRAIRHNEKILVYGDYDVDGTTAVSLVYTYIKKHYNRLDFYIPDRYSEGYGISIKGIDFAVDNGFSLIIALDCGIKAVEKIDYANERKIDFIICDHHRPGDRLPAACAILDPKREDCGYPYKELSGCGVGFKLIQALEITRTGKSEDVIRNLEEYLDLAVVSIASDIVPITGENRILAFHGLKKINTRPRVGLETILNVSNSLKSTGQNGKDQFFSRELTINDLVFIVGPRINAAGRIENARNSVMLLISDNRENAVRLSQQINNLNNERKKLDEYATSKAVEMIRNDPAQFGNRSTIIYDPDWHKGVIGIVASRLIELWYRPTIVLTRSEGLVTGSARSIKGFDIYEAVDACHDLLEHFGGHTYAAGLSMKPENLPKFKKRFEDYANEHIPLELLIPEIEVDATLDIKDITKKFYRILKQFAPFGPGNMSPVFVTRSLKDDGKARIVGNNHLKMSVYQEEVASFPISSIAFQLGEHYEYVISRQPFDICYHIEENEWNNKISFQLNIKDIKPSVNDPFSLVAD